MGSVLRQASQRRLAVSASIILSEGWTVPSPLHMAGVHGTREIRNAQILGLQSACGELLCWSGMNADSVCRRREADPFERDELLFVPEA